MMPIATHPAAGHPLPTLHAVDKARRRLLAAVSSRGNDAIDIRDAAHEACHGIQARHRGSWERESLHRGLLQRSRKSILAELTYSYAPLIAWELDARAVEQIVCAKLAVVCWSIKTTSDITFHETLHHFKIRLPSIGWIEEQVTQRLERPALQRMADRVLALRPKRKRPVP